MNIIVSFSASQLLCVSIHDTLHERQTIMFIAAQELR